MLRASTEARMSSALVSHCRTLTMADRLAPAWLRVVWMFCHTWVAWPGHVARQ